MRDCGPENPDPSCPDCAYQLEAKAAAKESFEILRRLLTDPTSVTEAERVHARAIADRYMITAVDFIDAAKPKCDTMGCVDGTIVGIRGNSYPCQECNPKGKS